MRSQFRIRPLGRFVVAGAALALLPSCASELTRTGSSPSYVIVESMQGASGAEPDTFGVPLLSDVLTLVEMTIGGEQVLVPTIFNDLAQVQFRLGMKNPTSPTGPTDINSVSLNR